MADGEVEAKKVKKNSKNNQIVIILGVLLLFAIGVAGYFWYDSNQAKSNTPEGIAAKNQEESDAVVSNLKTVLLIQSEADPTVAKVEEPDTLKKANPDFYKNVQVGDYLILYPERAVIFRDNETFIVNIAPIIDTSSLEQPNNSNNNQPQ